MAGQYFVSLLTALTVFFAVLYISQFINKGQKKNALIKAFTTAAEDSDKNIQQREALIHESLASLFPENLPERIEQLKIKEKEFFKNINYSLLDYAPASIALMPAFVDALIAPYLIILQETAGKLSQAKVQITDQSEMMQSFMRLETAMLTTIKKLSVLINEPEDENTLDIKKVLLNKLETVVTKVEDKIKLSSEEKLMQYEALIEQLKFEKKDLASKNKNIKNLVELIYTKYKDQLGITAEQPIDALKEDDLHKLFAVERRD